MKSLICDVCHKPLTTARGGLEYVHIAHRELCEDCNDKLNQEIKPILRAKQPFNYEWFDRLVQDSIEKAIARGKW
jgi:competence CoiA-like predicted nuclease